MKPYRHDSSVDLSSLTIKLRGFWNCIPWRKCCMITLLMITNDRHLPTAEANRISKGLNIPGFGPKSVIDKLKHLRSSYCQELKKYQTVRNKEVVKTIYTN